MLAVLSSIAAIAPRPARAYAPEAAEWLARHVVRSLPASAHMAWGDGEVAAALAVLRDEAERDPEGAERARHSAAAAPTPDAAGAREGFAGARDALWLAWTRGDRVALAGAIARLAQSACDLADPFFASPLDIAEPDGARAWFSDALQPGDLDAIVVAANQACSDDAAQSLASASAGRRSAIVAAASAGDEAALARVRAERLGAAAALADAVVRNAVEPGPSGRAGDLRLGPNPIRGAATLFVEIPARGAGRFELFDLSGRRIAERALGLLSAGPRRELLPGEWFDGLPAGLYLARVTVGALRAETRVSLLGH